MAAARRKKESPDVPHAPLPVSKPRKRFYMQKMPDGVGVRAVRTGNFRSGARAQAMADFYGSGTLLPTASNQCSMEVLLGELLSELDLQEEALAPELLSDAWRKAVGPALADVSTLAGVARGRARILVKHPTVRYEITRLTPHIIRALNQILGAGTVRSLVLASL